MSRAKGTSSVAAAAYRAGESLTDERTGLTHDFSDKAHVVHSEVMLPESAPEAFRDRGALWNAVEASETRVNSQVARELEISLPRELSADERIRLAHDYVQSSFVDRGMVADLNVHCPLDKDGLEQPHMHVMLTMREVGPDGFGKKQREWNSPALVVEWRREFAEMANARLAENDIDARIDHRSYRDQGIGLEASEKVGPGAKGRADRGEPSERVDANRETARRNGEVIMADPGKVLDAITAQQSTFTDRDLARHIHRNTDGAEQFGEAMAKVKASPDLVRLGQDGRGQDRFSSRSMVAAERDMARDSDQLAERRGHNVSERSLERGVGRTERDGLMLREDQLDAVRHVTRETGDLALVSGFAGSGKSTALGVAREAWEAEGHTVRGMALAGKAAKELEAGSGIESRTIASMEYAWKDGRDELTSRDVLVVDEAGMVGSRQLGRVLEHAREAGAKVVLVGDAEQLQAISAGAAFRALSERHGYAEINEVVRQHDPLDREATKELATGRTADAIDHYDDKSAVHASRTQQEARRDVADTWDRERRAAPDKSSLMLAYENRDVGALNELARLRMMASGDLGKGHQVATEFGEKEFATGDRVLFRKNDRGMGVMNGSLGTIKDVDARGNLTVKLDGKDGGTAAFNARDYGHVDHGYAATIHKAQGATVDRVQVLASQYMDRHATYVALSRHREGATLHYSHEQFADGATLRHQLGRERAKDTTLDYADAFARRRGVEPPRSQDREADRYTRLRNLPNAAEQDQAHQAQASRGTRGADDAGREGTGRAGPSQADRDAARSRTPSQDRRTGAERHRDRQAGLERDRDRGVER